MNILDQWTNVD